MSATFSRLDGVGCIAVRGADARAFLQAQLSQNIETLEPGLAPLAGWHDPRGRVRALFRVVQTPDRWLLLTPRDTVAALVPRLRMYVLRAAVVVEPADDVAVGAVLDGGAGLASGVPANTVLERDGVSIIRVDDGLAICVGPVAAVTAFGAPLAPAPPEKVEIAEIRRGLPTVSSTVAERFVAQMLNLDRLGAIAFDKGCYPGQEVITRVHNLGSVKRRMRRYSARGSAALAPGTEIVSADGTAVGEVVRAARDASRIELLAVVEHAAAAAPLHVPPDLALTPEPLPYDVPAK